MTDDNPASPPAEETFRQHLRQVDHWTFLVGFALVLVNIRARSRNVSIAAAILLFVAIIYDAYEFVAET